MYNWVRAPPQVQNSNRGKNKTLVKHIRQNSNLEFGKKVTDTILDKTKRTFKKGKSFGYFEYFSSISLCSREYFQIVLELRKSNVYIHFQDQNVQ